MSAMARAMRPLPSSNGWMPKPHEPGSKLCEFCTDKHFVYMYFRRFHGWHCSFSTEARKKLPREFTFRAPETIRELARRGGGLIDKWDREGFDLALELGKGGVWLRLSNDQYAALGGVL